HHHRGLHVQVVDHQVLCGVAHDVSDLSRGQIAVKDVFLVVVVVMHALRDVVAGRAGGDQRHVQAAGPGFQRQHHLTDVGGDDGTDLVFLGSTLERTNRVGGGVVVVVGDDL